MRRSGTPASMMLVLALAGAVASGEVDPVAVLGVGDEAFWDGDGHAVFQDENTAFSDFPLEVAGGGSVLRVAIDHSRYYEPYSVEILDPAGVVVASAGGWTSAEAFVDRPGSGTWVARARLPARAPYRYRMRAKLEGVPAPVPDPPVEALPNLRLIPPFEFTFAGPTGSVDLDLGIARGPNCSSQEVAETAARRCLRFSLGPANAGPGQFQIRFTALEGIVTKGVAYQRVYKTDGTFTERRAGEFEYHKTHAHYHHSGFGSLDLYRVTDPETGTKERVGEGPKQGFCTADIMMYGWERFIQAREPTGSDCVNQASLTGTNGPIGTTMGLTPGWADLYIWSQDGNYVEFGANGDGLYVVRATADTDDWILETDETDNTSYAYVRVTGEQVDVLERGYGADPWDPAKEIASDLLEPHP